MSAEQRVLSERMWGVGCEKWDAVMGAEAKHDERRVC